MTEFITFAGLILWLILIVMFFRLSSHVALIKDCLLNQGVPPSEAFAKHIAFGNKDEALKVLQEIVWRKYKAIVAGHERGNYNQRVTSELTKLREKYEPRFIELGSEYPTLK